MTRTRRRTPGKRVAPEPKELFRNPWPYMSDPEAMVKMQLDSLGVPYSWRFFDGDAPTLKVMIPDYAPEFTLNEYKIVLVVLGGFFGTLPGVLDRTALAKVILESDGWRVGILYEADIRRSPLQAVTVLFPELKNPLVKGPERANPLGAAAILGARLAARTVQLRGLAQGRSKFAKTHNEGTRRKQRDYIISRSRRRRKRGVGAELGAVAEQRDGG